MSALDGAEGSVSLLLIKDHPAFLGRGALSVQFHGKTTLVSNFILYKVLITISTLKRAPLSRPTRNPFYLRRIITDLTFSRLNCNKSHIIKLDFQETLYLRDLSICSYYRLYRWGRVLVEANRTQEYFFPKYLNWFEWNFTHTSRIYKQKI